MDEPHPLDGKLEPEMKGSTDERAPLYSIAISLKRIADALEGKDTYALSNMMENAGQAFALGMRGR